MAIVSSYGALQSVNAQPSWQHTSSGSLSLYGASQTYAEIYRTQPNVRICISFLGRNVGQCGLHVFRTVSETDRQRLRDHELADWLGNPNPGTITYSLIDSTVQDWALYLNAYWLKVRQDDRIGLVRLPPDQMRVEGGLLPSYFVWTVDGREKEFNPSEIVHFGGYNPCDPTSGLSPMETLRQLLAEERAGAEYRQHLWNNAARFEGVIEQDAAGPTYTPDQIVKFREQWQTVHGASGTARGGTAVMPKGMHFSSSSFSAKDSEYTVSSKLRREICAAMWHIPLPMVGILDHATFSNIREQHKHLYQDCLAPIMKMIEQEIARQLLPECEDTDGVYVEFNIAEKLKGSFEEQAAALQAAVGKPWMKVNEARARQNLPADDDPASDTIAAQQGGPSDNRQPDLPDDPEESAAAIIQTTQARMKARHDKLPLEARVEAFDTARWARELEADLVPLLGEEQALTTAGRVVLTELKRLEDEAHV